MVRHVAPSSAATGLFRIEAELKNPDGSIPGGLAVTVTATVQLYREALFLPTSAVRLEGTRAMVQRVSEGGPPEAIAIEIGPELEGRFPVLGGLTEGDRVLVR